MEHTIPVFKGTVMSDMISSSHGDNTLDEDQDMKRGHVIGNKRERKVYSMWYKDIEEENIRRIEAEWDEKYPGWREKEQGSR